MIEWFMNWLVPDEAFALFGFVSFVGVYEALEQWKNSDGDLLYEVGHVVMRPVKIDWLSGKVTV